MEKIKTDDAISAEDEVGEVLPEERESIRATEEFTPQSHDGVPAVATQSNEAVSVKLPEEHKKPEDPSEAVITAERSVPQSCNGTAGVAPQLSESVDIKVPGEHENPESNSASPQSHGDKSTPEIGSQMSESMTIELPEGPEAASQNCNTSIVNVPEAFKQQNEPMDMSEEDEESCSKKEAVDEGTVSPLCGGGSLALLSTQYRDDSSDDLSDSDSDSSSSTSSSSSSSSSGVITSMMNEHEQEEDHEDGFAPGKRPMPVKTQDELLIEDLPAVENLAISLPQDTEMEPIGAISSIVDQLVIIESKKDSKPLNVDSVLFSEDKIAIGRVFEVFGPVCQPYYILRFNSQEHIEQKKLRIGLPIFFAPKIKDFTDYIFTEQLNRNKGSDASWKNDQEPPPEALDFSDDEQERQAKHKLKEKRKQQQAKDESDSDNETPPCRTQKPSRRKPRQNRNRQCDHTAYQSPRGSFHGNYHANPHFQPQDVPHFQPRGNPHFQPDYMFPPPIPFHPPFQGPHFPPFPGPPPPHMGMGPWQPGPYPGMMFPPPPPPPPPSK